MRDRITTKDALVFITLLQQDVAGMYWMIWEAMSGALFLDWMKRSSHNVDSGTPASEARGNHVAPDDSATNASRTGAGEFSGQRELLDAA